MQNTLTGEVRLMFIRGGLSKKDTPYLQCSNGRAEFFLTVPKDFDVSVFENYTEGDMIDLTVSVLTGSDNTKLVDVLR